MIRVQSRSLRLAVAGLTLALLGAACGGPNPDAAVKGKVDETTTTTIAKGADTTASQLRSKLAGLFQEHVYLAAAVSRARGRPDESSAALAALGSNSDALSENMKAIFAGSDASVAEQFSALWKRQTDLVSGGAPGDLAQNARDLGALLNSAMPSLPAEAVSGPLTAADQAVGNGTNFTGLRTAASQMVTLASAVVGAIAKKLPDKIAGDPSSKAAELLTSLNAGLREHVFLLSAATDAILGGRADEFAGAKAALDGNSDAITAVIAGVYGDDAGSKFGPLWKKHIDFLADYTNAVGAKDQAKADEAMDSLLAYTDEFGGFINTASPKLAKDTVSEMIKTHIFTLKDMIDAQAAKAFTKADTSERTAADHMTMVATSLANIVVAQFPPKF